MFKKGLDFSMNLSMFGFFFTQSNSLFGKKGILNCWDLGFSKFIFFYLREKEYLGDKFFATAGKSKYETELTEEQKERQQRYLNYLEKIKETGEAVSDEQLAETKEQILGD